MKNSVFIATSLDGYIADKDGGIEFLNYIPEINSIDTGYNGFMSGIDALLMGRGTFEVVDGFDIEWPYQKPVFVLSNTLSELDPSYDGKVQLMQGSPDEVLLQIHDMGFKNLYIDGGKLIQGFLQKDLIDEMIITIIPILLGEGIPLFGNLSKNLHFECTETKHFLDKIVQNHYVRSR